MPSARPSVAPATGSRAPHGAPSALFATATADAYAATLHAVVDDVAARVGAVTQPWSGASRAQLAALVDAGASAAAGLWAGHRGLGDGTG